MNNNKSEIQAISTIQPSVKEFFTKLQLEMIEDALEKRQNNQYMINIVANNDYDSLETNDPKRKLIENYNESAKALKKISRMIDLLEK